MVALIAFICRFTSALASINVLQTPAIKLVQGKYLASPYGVVSMVSVPSGVVRQSMEYSATMEEGGTHRYDDSKPGARLASLDSTP